MAVFDFVPLAEDETEWTDVPVETEEDEDGFSFTPEKEPEDIDFSAAKPHQIFSVDGSNTNAPKRLGAAAKSFYKNKKLHNAAVFGESIAQSVTRGLLDTAGGIGSFINWYGDNMILPEGFLGMDKKTIDRLNSFGRGWQKAGGALKKGADFVLKDKGLELDEATFGGDFIDNPSFTRASAAIASAAPSLMSMAGIVKLTGSAGLAYFIMGGVDSADIYEASKEAGQDLDKTNILYGSAMAGTALIDKLLMPVERILGKKLTGKSIGKKIADRIVGGSLEAIGEGSQTFVQNFVHHFGIDKTKNLFEGVIESAIGGFGSGAFATGAFERASDALKETGATQEEIDAMVDAGAMYVQQHPDEINDIAFQQLNEGLSNFEKFVEEHKGTPEAAAALQKKAEIDTVGQAVFDRLVNAGTEENIARAQSRVVQGISLWGAEETGLSPLEYFNRRFPEVRREKFREFREKSAKAKEKGVDLFEVLVNPREYRRHEKAEKKGASLLSFLRKNGGLKDEGGDLKAMDAGKLYVGLVNNKTGRSVDDMALEAWEAGYFPEFNERPEVNDLLEAIRDELSGNKRYAFKSDGNISIIDAVDDLADQMDQLGVDYSHMSAREAEQAFNDAVAAYNAEQSAPVDDADAYFADDDYVPTTQTFDEDIPFQSDMEYTDETIDIDGVEKPVRNSDGQRIARTEEGLRAFYEWFGDSKVVDEQGRPLVVYHGSHIKNIEVFKPQRIKTKSKGVGNYFSDKQEVADTYGTEYSVPGKTYSVYLKMKNPLIVDYNGKRFNELIRVDGNLMGKQTGYSDTSVPSSTEISEYAFKNGYDGAILKNIRDVGRSLAVYNEESRAELKKESFESVFEKYKEDVEKDTSSSQILSMFDGKKKAARDYMADMIVQTKEEEAVKGKETANDYVVFEPEQIKSVENIGTFDAENPNIYYQSAFAGSRVDYDKPSLEAINSGEGAQAHGWGLYYALDKDVAEGYRKKFSKPYTRFISFGEIKYNPETKSYENAFDETTLEFDVYRDFKLNAEGDFDVLIKSYNQTIDFQDTHRRLEIAKKYKDYFINGDVHYFEDESIAKGQVHEVDIPENPYLLDEQKPFSEQSDFVKEKLNELFDNIEIPDKVLVNFTGSASNPYKNVAKHKTGREIYKDLAKILHSDKAASELLKKYGIKGITYEGARDGRCFVIFDDKDVKVIQKFYQGRANAPKGAYYDNVIYLFEKANASTFMHETAHWFKNELERFGTERSRAMLDKVNKWESEEYARRYKTELKDGRYIVRDTLGNVAYDMNFQTARQAEDHAKNEIFARGFEAYLKEGKSPNNSMKQAFKAFWNWLRHLYRSAKSLNVELNDDIRSVYSDIIGGEDIDFYLNAPASEVIRSRQKLQKEKEAELDGMIERAVEEGKGKNFLAGYFAEKTEAAKDRTRWWNKAMVPISTRAYRVNPRLKNKLRGYEYTLNKKLNEKMEKIKPFLEKWAKFTNDDDIAFDLAVKNQYDARRDMILEKYDAVEEFKAVQSLLQSIYDEAASVKVEMGYKADYFPRQVADVDGLLSFLHGEEMASELRRAESEAGFADMTPEEQADFLNKFLRGFNRKDTTAPLPGNVKKRTIVEVTPQINQFYKPSMQALTNYVERMNASIESRKFWGFDMDNIEDSIGAFVDELIENEEIAPDQDKEVEEILRARFKAKGVSNKYLLWQKNASYIYTMGGVNSAITQIDDISVALYKAGFWNTVNSILKPNRPGLSREELGLQKIGQEFMEATTMSKAVDKVFKMTGLDKIDGFGKNVLINATFNKFQNMAKTDEAALRERIGPILEGETDSTIEDIKEGKISDNVKLLMFNELADMQPIALSEMPEYYLTSGNGRVLYMLKTFMLKRIDIFRNECFDKIRAGQTKEGIQNLFRLASLMILCGVSKDAIIDMMFGRRIYLTDAIVNNVLGLFGITKYQLYKARDEGFEGFASSFIPPLFSMWTDLGRDISKKLFSDNGKDIKDFEVLKGVPLVGRFYYWWLGGGRTKEKKKRKGAKLK